MGSFSVSKIAASVIKELVLARRSIIRKESRVWQIGNPRREKETSAKEKIFSGRRQLKTMR